MKYLALVVGVMLLICSASALTWTSTSGCWTATDGTYNFTKWNATGNTTWTIPTGVNTVDYFIIGGGAAGSPGGNYGGGGGAGQVINATGFAVTPDSSVNVTVGIGGAGASGSTSHPGFTSSFSTLYAIGGSITGGSQTGGTSGNGFGGGLPASYGGGGGGATGAGATGKSASTGAGGTGTTLLYFTGESTRVAGGGGGAAHDGSGGGGVGTDGGGAGGSNSAHNNGYSATNETGGGGGGAVNAVSGSGGNGVVILRYQLPVINPTPIVSFTSNVTNGVQPLHVQFNDTSVTNITAWNWSFDDGNYSALQDPVHTFYNGVYHITLNVTNASGYNLSTVNYPISVSDSGGLSGWNRQDIIMEQVFTLAFLVKDSSNHNGITGATIQLSNGDSATTDLVGGANFSLNYSTVVATFSMTGYSSRQISYVVTADRTETVYLDPVVIPVNTTSNTNIVYVPKQVELTVVYYDPAGVVVPNAHVDLTAVANTLQADSQLETLYGINPNAANQLMNGTLVMHGNTDSSGGIVFTILQSINYQAQVTDPATGTVYTAMLFPGSDPYTVWIGTNPIKNQTPSNAAYMNQTRLFVTQPDAGNITDNLIYQDLSGKTTSVTFVVKYASNLSVAYTATQAVSGTNPVYMNYTHPNIRGMGIFYGWNATKVT